MQLWGNSGSRARRVRLLLAVVCLVALPVHAALAVSILYAPSEGDDPAYRAAIAAYAGGPVDYFDPRGTTPTLEQLQAYDCVYTWANSTYANPFTFGDTLADYVDAGGRVILGVFTTYTNGAHLSGRIMSPGYSPVTSPDGDNHFSSSTYAGDGTTALHTGVTTYECTYRDRLVLQGDGVQDGSYLDGEIAHAYRPDFKVVYSNGAGATNLECTGDWALLVANACLAGAAECGNGTVESGEACDDGNLDPGDCCDASCQFEANGAACGDDGNVCTADVCDGAGTCVHDATPASGCRAAGKSLLLIKNNADDAKDKLTWKWLKGAATTVGDLGDPTAASDYTLCLYSGTSAASLAIPAGPGWKAAGNSGFKYADATGAPDGVQKASLKAGAAGKAKALVKGKGINLPDAPAPALTLPVTVQLVGDGACFESVFPAATKNDTKQFKAKTP